MSILRNRKTFRDGLMALGICASLAVANIGISGRAEARMPDGDRMSESAQVCGAIQDNYDVSSNFREMAGTTADFIYWQNQMFQAIADWHNAGCDSAYGSISFRISTGGSNGKLNGTVLQSAGVATAGVEPAGGGKTITAGRAGTARTLAR